MCIYTFIVFLYIDKFLLVNFLLAEEHLNIRFIPFFFLFSIHTLSLDQSYILFFFFHTLLFNQSYIFLYMLNSFELYI